MNTFVNILGVLLFAFGIAASIALHELGHLATAKAFGMKVTRYFIGFGPKLFSFRKGETEYGLKAIPAGAYVRIIGMSNLEEIAPEDEARTYRAQSYPKRLATVLGGPMANFAIAAVLLFVVFAGFGLGRTTDWAVEGVVEGSAAAAVASTAPVAGDTLRFRTCQNNAADAFRWWDLAALEGDFSTLPFDPGFSP